MEKKLFWLVTNNEDLNVTVIDLETVKTVIENDIDGVEGEDVEALEYTITPFYTTQEEFEKLTEAE